MLFCDQLVSPPNLLLVISNKRTCQKDRRQRATADELTEESNQFYHGRRHCCRRRSKLMRKTRRASNCTSGRPARTKVQFTKNCCRFIFMTYWTIRLAARRGNKCRPSSHIIDPIGSKDHPYSGLHCDNLTTDDAGATIHAPEA